MYFPCFCFFSQNFVTEHTSKRPSNSHTLTLANRMCTKPRHFAFIPDAMKPQLVKHLAVIPGAT